MSSIEAKSSAACGSWLAETCGDMEPLEKLFLPLRDYDLAATLTSGQAFRWVWRDGAWEGVIGSHWVRLRPQDNGILAETLSVHASAGGAWQWLIDYLQTDVDLGSILLTFPDDEPMRAAVAACRGLRLLRQEPWECLASFILSSTKQIVQIQQIVTALCLRFGIPVPAKHGDEPVFAFPTAARLAATSEAELRACKMGFRAPNLLVAAQMVAGGELDLDALRHLTAAEARERLLRVPGVGEKIANCVLLFAYGIQEAFPVDVWVKKALRQLYFPKRQPTSRRLEHFIATHFGPNSGYAQQYLFHYIRIASRQRLAVSSAVSSSDLVK
jgi:N-glycosylase/DNA lyase